MGAHPPLALARAPFLGGAVGVQGHRIGYVRVSSFDQNPERQLEETEVSKVFTDKASGRTLSAPSSKRC